MDSQDTLTTSDWLEIADLVDLLKPLAIASKVAQTTATHGGAGALHTTLTQMERILTHLETKKTAQTHAPASHYKACVNLGWVKLNKYYGLSDKTGAYRLAVLLNPHYKMRWFNHHWREKRAWLADVRQLANTAYIDAKKMWADEVPRSSSPPRPPSSYDAYDELTDDEADADELARYLAAPLARWKHKPVDGKPGVYYEPLDWWRDNQSSYPVLSHLAFELLAAPASTAADERLFSMAGNVVNEERPLTQQELAEATQVLRSACEAGIA